MKKLIFFSLLQKRVTLLLFYVCFLCYSIVAQTNQCGTYLKRTRASEPEFMDRFGNTYDKADLIPQKTVADCGTLTKFQLVFDPKISQKEKETICDVFKYIEDNVITNIPKVKAQIEFKKDALLPGVLADATPFFSIKDCGIRHPTVFLTMLGETTYENKNVGVIRLNSNYDKSWHHTNDPANVPAGKWVDLYSVVLHEALHILGFASLIDASSKNILSPKNTATNWDRFLFDANHQEYLLENFSTEQCCQNYQYNEKLVKTDTFNKKCKSNIWFTDKNTIFIAPLSCHDNTTSALSHLSNECAKGNSFFVTNPDLPDNTERRILAEEEVQILCTLGYNTVNANKETCSASSLVAVDDCDATIYTLANPNGAINILQNDIVKGKYKLLILQDYDKKGIKITYDQNGNVTYTFLKRGKYDIHYQLTDMNEPSTCVNATLRLVCIDPNLGNCCPTKECIVSCLGDFEQFTSNFELRHYMTNTTQFCDENPFLINSNQGVNTIDLLSDGTDYTDYCDDFKIKKSGPAHNGSNYLGFWSGSDTEGFTLPLCRIIPANSKASVTFWARVNEDCLTLQMAEPEIDFVFLANLPTSGSIVNPPFFPPTNIKITSSVFTKYQFDFTTVGPTDVSALLFYGYAIGYVYFNIDDIVVTTPPSAEFTYKTCPKLAVTSKYTDTAIHTWTATTANGQQPQSSSGPSGAFIFNLLPNGTYTITHTVETDCGKSTSSQVVTIACLECGCDAANTLTIKASPNGTLFSTLNLPQIIDKSVHNSCIAIEGKLILDQNVIIQDCADIIMQSCSEIVVNKSKNFTVNNNIIYGCKKMWKGITVEAGGRLTFTNNTIKDAEFSIDANASKILSLPSTRILVRNNVFQKNHIGVRINGSNTNKIMGHAPFINNTFIGNGATDLLPSCTDKLANYSAKFGYAGLIVTGVNFVVGTSKDTKITNTFSSLRNGILSSDNDLQVFNATFNDLEVMGDWTDEKIDPISSKSFGIGILSNRTKATVRGCTFKKCGHAVFAKNSILSVTKCDMPEVYRGVEFVNGLQIDVNDNETIHYKNRGIIGRELSYAKTSKFNINRNKIHNVAVGNITEGNNNVAIEMVNKTADTLTQARMFKNVIILDNKDHGIYVKQSGKWTIDGNYIQYENLAKDYQSGLGYAFRFDNSRRNYLYDNLTEDVAGKGRSFAYALSMSQNNDFCCNVAEGNQIGLFINGACDNTNLKTTSFSHHELCMSYTAQGVTGIETNKGNTFSISSGTAKHIGDPVTIDKSLYRTKDKTSTEFPQKISVPTAYQGNWFDENLKNSLTCSTCTVPPIAPLTPEISELDLFVINEGFGNKTTGNRTSQWESERDLFRRISENPNLLSSNDDVNNFYLKNKKGKLGAHFEVDKSIRGISENTEEVDAKIEELLFRIDDINKTAEKEYINLTKAITFEDSLMIYGAAEEIRITATPHTLLLNALLEDAEKLQAEKAASVLPMIAALEADDLATKNRKSILAIYANNLAQGGGILSSEDLEKVSAIAYQCVEEGGTAVIMARAIYESYDDTFIDDNLLCNPSSNPIISRVAKNQKQSDAIDLDVFPNPAQDNVTLMVISPDKAPFEIVVTDYTGVIVRKITNNGNPNSVYTINTNGLSSGIYFCRLLTARGSIITKKLIIQK